MWKRAQDVPGTDNVPEVFRNYFDSNGRAEKCKNRRGKAQGQADRRQTIYV